MMSETNNQIIAFYNREITIHKKIKMPFISEMLIEAKCELIENPDFLQWDWDNLDVIKNNKSTFLTILSINSVFPISEITTKLKASRILKKNSKWILDQDRFHRVFSFLLDKYPKIDDSQFLFIIFNYIIFKTKSDLLKSIEVEFDLNKAMNKLTRNRRKSPKTLVKNLHNMKDLYGTFYSASKSSNPKKVLKQIFNGPKDPLEYLTKNIVNFMITAYRVKFGDKAAKVFAGAMAGDSYSYMRMLPIESIEKNGKKEMYRDLFPLFNLIIKDKTYLSSGAYKKNNAKIGDNYGVYDNYDAYKIAMVKTILGRTNSPKPKLIQK